MGRKCRTENFQVSGFFLALASRWDLRSSMGAHIQTHASHIMCSGKTHSQLWSQLNYLSMTRTPQCTLIYTAGAGSFSQGGLCVSSAPPCLEILWLNSIYLPHRFVLLCGRVPAPETRLGSPVIGCLIALACQELSSYLWCTLTVCFHARLQSPRTC